MGTVEEILKNPWHTTQLPYDSSSDSDDYNEKGMDIDDAADNGGTLNESTFQLKELFFFHADDPELENRISGKLPSVISYDSMLCAFNQKKKKRVLPFFFSKNGRGGPSRRSPNLPLEVLACGGKLRRGHLSTQKVINYREG